MQRKNKECAKAHSRVCGGRLQHLPYTPKCASSRSVFCFTGTQFPVKQKTVRKHFSLRAVFYYIIIRLGLLDPNPDLPES